MNWSSKIIVSNHDEVKSNQKKLVNMVLVDDEQIRNLVRTVLHRYVVMTGPTTGIIIPNFVRKGTQSFTQGYMTPNNVTEGVRPTFRNCIHHSFIYPSIHSYKSYFSLQHIFKLLKYV